VSVARIQRKIAQYQKYVEDSRRNKSSNKDPTLGKSLLDFIPFASERLAPPLHLEPITNLFEAAIASVGVPVELRPAIGMRNVISAPPQHGKTEVIKHAIAMSMLRNPHTRNAYISYGIQRAQEISLEIKELCERILGAHVSGNKDSWKLPNGSSLFATGIDGTITGRPIDGLCIIDDPLKSYQDANSATVRASCIRGYCANIKTRVHNGVPIFDVQTRWHINDLGGYLTNVEKYNSVNLPAISEHGNALWPEHRPLAFLRQFQSDNYTWNALYMGCPVPEGGALFGAPKHYGKISDIYAPGCREPEWAIGIDLAYSKKSYSDYSVAVRMCRAGDYYYVTDMLRLQCDASAFAHELRRFIESTPGMPAPFGFVHGPEVGVISLLADKTGHPIDSAPASADKRIRAQQMSAAWNESRVLIPNEQWTTPMVDEMRAFTGLNDDHDDIVDATVAAFHRLCHQPEYNVDRRMFVNSKR
jgi:predicted phage terminase large subunit-like protein